MCITDMPGLDDKVEERNIKNFIEKELLTIVPIFLFDLSTGTTELQHFENIKGKFDNS